MIKTVIGGPYRYLMLVLVTVAIFLTMVPWYSHHLQVKSLQQAENGRHVEALHSAYKAVSFNPTSVNARFILAGSLQRIGRDEEAKGVLVQATEMQPLNYATWEQLATFESKYWGMPQSAKEHIIMALSLNPQDKQLKEKADTLKELAGSTWNHVDSAR